MFNKVCRAEQLQPIYVNIRVNGDNRKWSPVERRKTLLFLKKILYNTHTPHDKPIERDYAVKR
jgi:hypothetical protein